MRKFLALLILLIPSCAMTPLVTEPAAPTDFEFACDALEIDCDKLGINPPIPVVSWIVPNGFYGLYYPGEPYIFITRQPEPETLERIYVHESVHYILYEADARLGRCYSERKAREVTALYSGIEYDPSWEVRYGCNNGEADGNITGPYIH